MSASPEILRDNLQVVNVVGTGEIQGNVNLEKLFAASDTQVAQYDPIHHQGCYFRFEGPDGPLVTVYNSGRFIIRAASLEKVQEQRETTLDYLRDVGEPAEVIEKYFSINNVVGVSDLGVELDLGALLDDLAYPDDGQDELRGRIGMRYPDNKTYFNISRSGKVTLMGASSLEELEAGYERFLEELGQLFDTTT